VALGVIVGFTKIVSRKAILASLVAHSPQGTAEANRRALEAGFKMARGIKG